MTTQKIGQVVNPDLLQACLEGVKIKMSILDGIEVVPRYQFQQILRYRQDRKRPWMSGAYYQKEEYPGHADYVRRWSGTELRFWNELRKGDECPLSPEEMELQRMDIRESPDREIPPMVMDLFEEWPPLPYN